MKLFLPYWVKVAIDGLCSFLRLADLDSDIGVTRSCLILCLESLGTKNCKKTKDKLNESLEAAIIPSQNIQT